MTACANIHPERSICSPSKPSSASLFFYTSSPSPLSFLLCCRFSSSSRASSSSFWSFWSAGPKIISPHGPVPQPAGAPHSPLQGLASQVTSKSSACPPRC
ncbi:unnamed protein product [Gadus morhua 'NCC']